MVWGKRKDILASTGHPKDCQADGCPSCEVLILPPTKQKNLLRPTIPARKASRPRRSSSSNQKSLTGVVEAPEAGSLLIGRDNFINTMMNSSIVSIVSSRHQVDQMREEMNREWASASNMPRGSEQLPQQASTASNGTVNIKLPSSHSSHALPTIPSELGPGEGVSFTLNTTSQARGNSQHFIPPKTTPLVDNSEPRELGPRFSEPAKDWKGGSAPGSLRNLHKSPLNQSQSLGPVEFDEEARVSPYLHARSLLSPRSSSAFAGVMSRLQSALSPASSRQTSGERNSTRSERQSANRVRHSEPSQDQTPNTPPRDSDPEPFDQA
eukprot:g51983.t1